MPTQYEDDEDTRDTGNGEREISLGTGTILGIFLALALVCSLFFGLGYSMGRKSSPATAPSATSSRLSNPFSESDAASDKPLSSSPPSHTASARPRPDGQVTQPTEPGQQTVDISAPNPTSEPAGRSASHDRQQTGKPPATVAGEPTPSTGVVSPGSQVFVQVAAVSRKEDADLLLSALHRRGYTGLIRPQPQDKLLHVQLGPFAAKKDAEAMRQRLIADGYNPILK